MVGRYLCERMVGRKTSIPVMSIAKVKGIELVERNQLMIAFICESKKFDHSG